MMEAVATGLSLKPEVVITKQDLGKLNGMIGNYAPIISWEAATFLLRELGRARVVEVDAILPTIVTMNSQLEVRDETTGKTDIVTLTFPHEQAHYRDSVSVVTPLGTALLGLSMGQSMSYLDRDGTQKTITVLTILYQPETGQSDRH
jgi:regulator of nucleoside diphosphate kinase